MNMQEVIDTYIEALNDTNITAEDFANFVNRIRILRHLDVLE